MSNSFNGAISICNLSRVFNDGKNTGEQRELDQKLIDIIKNHFSDGNPHPSVALPFVNRGELSTASITVALSALKDFMFLEFPDGREIIPELAKFAALNIPDEHANVIHFRRLMHAYLCKDEVSGYSFFGVMDENDQSNIVWYLEKLLTVIDGASCAKAITIDSPHGVHHCPGDSLVVKEARKMSCEVIFVPHPTESMAVSPEYKPVPYSFLHDEGLSMTESGESYRHYVRVFDEDYLFHYNMYKKEVLFPIPAIVLDFMFHCCRHANWAALVRHYTRDFSAPEKLTMTFSRPQIPDMLQAVIDYIIDNVGRGRHGEFLFGLVNICLSFVACPNIGRHKFYSYFKDQVAAGVPRYQALSQVFVGSSHRVGVRAIEYFLENPVAVFSNNDPVFNRIIEYCNVPYPVYNISLTSSVTGRSISLSTESVAHTYVEYLAGRGSISPASQILAVEYTKKVSIENVMKEYLFMKRKLSLHMKCGTMVEYPVAVSPAPKLPITLACTCGFKMYSPINARGKLFIDRAMVIPVAPPYLKICLNCNTPLPVDVLKVTEEKKD